MTNSERLTSHNALIDEAIAKAEALPEAGGGGASVETCTVTVTCSGQLNTVIAASFVDGDASYVGFIDGFFNPRYTATLENVICGSPIIITTNVAIPGVTVGGGCVYIDYQQTNILCTAPTESGATGTIDIIDQL